MGYHDLLIAAQGGIYEMLLLLIERGENVNSGPSQSNILEEACVGGESPARIACVKLLLAHGAKLGRSEQKDSPNHRCNSAIHRAAMRGSKGMVSILLDAGEEVDLRSNCGNTPLRVAIEGFTHGKRAENEALYEVCKILIKRGANVNDQKGYRSQAPLHAAAFYGATKMLTLLLDSGANVKAIDADGNTPRFIAATRSSECARILREHGGR